MQDSNSSDFSPITPDKLQPGKKFAANYAGEHVAEPDFVFVELFFNWVFLFNYFFYFFFFFCFFLLLF